MKLISILFILFLLHGCKNSTNVTFSPQVIPHVPDKKAPSNASHWFENIGEKDFKKEKDNSFDKKRIRKTNAIWRKEYQGKRFFMSPSNYQVGDIIRIKININTNAQMTTDFSTDAKKKSNSPKYLDKLAAMLIRYLIPYGLGELKVNDKLSIPDEEYKKFEYTGDSTFNKFDSNGKSSMSDTISFQIPVVIRRTFANGVMYVKGSQEFIVKKDKRIVSISGLVRSEDISEKDNSIDSSKVAEARVMHSDDGKMNVSENEEDNSFIDNFIGR